MPDGSLGRTYAEQLQRLNLTPERLIDPRPITTPAESLTHRMRETHYIVHGRTGFGIDGPGELGLPEAPLA